MARTLGSQVGNRSRANVGKRGRPAAADMLTLDARLLEAARVIFVDRGYAAATIDAIADEARASKRTVYDRIGGKAALFEAVVSDYIQRRFAVTEALVKHATEAKLPVAEKLRLVGEAFHASSTDPESITLDRIVTGQANSFPMLAARLQGEGRDRAISIVGDMLADAGATRPELAAQAFYAVLVLQPLHIGAVAGETIFDCEAVVEFVLGGAGL